LQYKQYVAILLSRPTPSCIPKWVQIRCADNLKARFTQRRIAGLQALSDLLYGVEITCLHYKLLLRKEGKDVFIFLGPPYWNARSYSLYSQKGDLKKFFDHKELAQELKLCTHKWLMTFDGSKIVKEQFSFANIYSWKLKYKT